MRRHMIHAYAKDDGHMLPSQSTTSGQSGVRRLAAQIGKFGIVGVIAFAIDYGVLMLLSQAFGMNPVVAAGISFVVSTVFNYLASMRYVFTHRGDISRTREFVTFVILSVIGLGMNEVIMERCHGRHRHQGHSNRDRHGVELLQPQEVARRREPLAMR